MRAISLSYQDANDHLTWYYYDTLNRLTKVRNPLGMETTYGYDPVGNRTDQWDAKGQHIHYDYDNLNRLTVRTFGSSGSIEYGYDDVGNRTSMVDSREWMDDVEYQYNELNRLTDVVYGESEKTIHYDYDNNGNRTLMWDAEEGETVYHYDSMNRLDYLDDPDEGTTDYAYDAGSRLTDITYPNGTWTHYTYDAANRITGMVTKNSGGEVIQGISYPEEGYDRVGNRRIMIDGTGTTTYGYDALYRLTGVTYPDEKTEAYEYDRVGNRTIKKVNGVPTEQYGYNEANQLKTRQTSGSGAPTKEITVTGTVSDPSYPPYSGIGSVTVNGVAATVDGNSFTAEGVVLHQGANTISSVAKDVAGNASTQSITVTYDPDITSKYDYVYDNNGNLATMTKHVDGSPPPPDETTQYEYDYENRMTKVILPNSTTNEFSYDGDKRRVSSKNAAGQVTRFLYDGVNNLKDYDADWEPVASYVQGIGIDKLISRKDADGVRYYHADVLGSTRIMTDSDEATSATYAYDAWGKITSQSGEASNKHKFTAREWEDEIKLQYNRARFYDPETGRFITQDPLTKGPDDPTVTYYSGVYSIIHRYLKDYVDSLQPDKTNRYVYCYNNPINLIDPLGLEPEDRDIDALSDAERAEIYGDDKEKDAGQKTETGTEQQGQTAEDVKKAEGLNEKTTIDSIEDRQQARDEYKYADETLKERPTASNLNEQMKERNAQRSLSGWERAGGIGRGGLEIINGGLAYYAAFQSGGLLAVVLIPVGAYSISMGIAEVIAAAGGERVPIPDPIVSVSGELGKAMGSEGAGRAVGHGINIAIDAPRYGPLDITKDTYSLIKTIENVSETINDPVINEQNRKEPYGH